MCNGGDSPCMIYIIIHVVDILALSTIKDLVQNKHFSKRYQSLRLVPDYSLGIKSVQPIS